MKKKVFIPDPDISQATAMIKFIRRYTQFEIITSSDLLEGKGRSFQDIDLNTDTDIDYILPCGAEATTKILSKHKKIDFFEFQMDQDVLRCNDKLFMFDLCDELNIPIPKTSTSYKNIEFPLYFKQHNEYIEGKVKERGVIKTERQLKGISNSHDYIFQELIDGSSTYGFAFIAKDGKVLSSFQFEEVLSNPLAGGNGVLLKTSHESTVKQYSETLIAGLNYNGWGLAEFKYSNKYNDFYFMEINAKLWASLEFTLLNNTDFFYNMFGVSYKTNKVTKAVYIDRLLNLFLHQYCFLLPEIIHSKFLYARDFYGTLKSFFKKYVGY